MLDSYCQLGFTLFLFFKHDQKDWFYFNLIEIMKIIYFASKNGNLMNQPRIYIFEIVIASFLL